jgi:Fe-S-cluster containining protein
MIEFAVAEYARKALSQQFTEDADDRAMLGVLLAAADYAERSSQEMRPPADRKLHACRAGCGHCCHMRVVATIPEVAAIMQFIVTNLSSEAITAMRQQVIETSQHTHGMSDEQWGLGQYACPLLVDDKCSVYAARPLDCRAYNSTDVRLCRVAAQNYLEWDVPTDDSWTLALKSAQAGFLQALAGIGQRPRLVELTAALRVVFSETRAIERWFAGENLFADAELADSDPEQRAFLPWVPSDELREFAETHDSIPDTD